MGIDALKRLQSSIEALESTMMRRENVIRFLIGRIVLMLAMLAGFWIAMRQTL